MVSAAAMAAVSASISTPVRSTACTRASMRTSPALSSQATSTSAPARTMGWQSGRMSGVRFAAMMPARRAAASASPFSSRPSLSSLRVSREQRSSARATATREVRCFSPTSIIFMALEAPIPELLVVFTVEVADLVHQRVAHLAVQLFVVVRRAGKVPPVEQDAGLRAGRGAVWRRAEEAEDAGRERGIGGGQVRDLRQIGDLEIRPREPRLDVGRELGHLVLHDLLEDAARRLRRGLEGVGVELVRASEVGLRGHLVVGALGDQAQVVLGPRVGLLGS